MSTYPFNLGTYSRHIKTDSAEAQTWFDRGLNWMYGYNWEEAENCFARALNHDPFCAMAHWGIAYSLGPNYNKPWPRFRPDERSTHLARAQTSLRKALKLVDGTSEVEYDLIDALTLRYQTSDPADIGPKWNDDYANAMRLVHMRHSNDVDVTALFVEAMMNRTPWRMWDHKADEPVAGADTVECRNVLEAGISKNRAEGLAPHPGLWHLYVHLMEMSPTPELALPVADELRTLVPDAGHLAHMPTHIYVQCGDYRSVVDWNNAAIVQDERYWEYAGARNTYSRTRAHDYHTKLFGAMLLGDFGAAMSAVEGLERTIPATLVTDGTFQADWLEPYMSVRTHALVRFGKWPELIAEPVPVNPEQFTMTTAMNYYGKGIAYAALKQPDEARGAQEQFEYWAERVPEGSFLHAVPCREVLKVGRLMLAGELAYHRGEHDDAFKHLRAAAEVEDELPFDEPWAWMMPSRHALGALLLEQDHVEEAAQVYEADLGLTDDVIRANQHPSNVWALLGLHTCYERLGKVERARLIKGERDRALARADVSLGSSCFCSQPVLGAQDHTPRSSCCSQTDSAEHRSSEGRSSCH